MSMRQQIIDAMDARFKAIKIANGYNTDLGNKVYRWKTTAIEAGETMALIYRDLTADVFESAHNKHDHRLSCEAEIIALAGTITDNEVRKMLADVIKAIGANPFWSGLAITTKITGHSIDAIEQMDKIVGGGKVTFEVHYRTNLFEI